MTTSAAEKSYAQLCIERAYELEEQRDKRLLEVLNDYNPDIRWWLTMAREHMLTEAEQVARLDALIDCEERAKNA